MPDSLITINGESVQALEILFLTTLIALLPSMLAMMTSFSRYIISLSFLRTAMGTQQTPPNNVLVGIAIFLTLLTMTPTMNAIQTQAFEPYTSGEIGGEEFVVRAAVPLKSFMLDNTDEGTVKMFCELAHIDEPANRAEAEALSLRIIIPSFMTSELKKGFTIGFLLYLPFLLIDVVVAATLMSMGMVMLPPAMISTPFKLLLFISVNGWDLLFSTLVQGVK